MKPSPTTPATSAHASTDATASAEGGGPVGVVAIHSVRDYAAWRRSFDAHQPQRRAAGFLSEDVHVGLKDPNLVAVYSVASDRAHAEAFINNPALAAAMESSGVLGRPQIVLLAPLDDRHTDAPGPAAFVVGEVADLAAWKRSYDDASPMLKQAGVVGDAVSVVLGQPDTVAVYQQFSSADAMEAFYASEALAEAMKAGGVRGRPQVTLWSRPRSQA